MNESEFIKASVIWAIVIVGGLFVGHSLSGYSHQGTTRIIILAIVAGSILSVVAFRGLGTEGLTRLQGTFYIGFVGSVALVWTPFNGLAYVSPVFFLALIILLMSVGGSSQILVRTVRFLLLWVLIALVYKALNQDFVDQNAIIALVTYGSFVPMVAIPSPGLGSPILLKRMMRVVLIVAVIQFLIGISQAVLGMVLRPGSLWDFVEGTMHIGFAPSGGLESIMFACNAVAMLLAIVAYGTVGGKARWYVYALGIAALVLGSVVHVILVALLAIILAMVLFRPVQGKGSQRQAAAILAVCVVMSPIVLGTVFKRQIIAAPTIIQRAATNQNPKTKLVTRSLNLLEYQNPLAKILGLGPGQNGSRACLIAAGYLGSLPGPFKIIAAPAFASSGLELWIDYFQNPFRSASNRPGTSWAAALLEFGFLGFLLLPVVLAYMLYRLLKGVQAGAPRILAFSAGALILLIFGLGAIEHYWEVPQAVFVPMLLIKVMYSITVHNPRFRHDETKTEGTSTREDSPLPARLNLNQMPVKSSKLGAK